MFFHKVKKYVLKALTIINMDHVTEIGKALRKHSLYHGK